MKLFGKKKVVVMPSLQERATAVVDNLKTDLLLLNEEADNALAAFRRTVDRIDMINGEIAEKKAIAQSQIAELTQLVTEFDKAEASNTKVKSKIVEFLS